VIIADFDAISLAKHLCLFGFSIDQTLAPAVNELLFPSTGIVYQLIAFLLFR
jgi:hypothetical protein